MQLSPALLQALVLLQSTAIQAVDPPPQRRGQQDGINGRDALTATDTVAKPTAIRKMSPYAGEKFFPLLDMAFAATDNVSDTVAAARQLAGLYWEEDIVGPLAQERAEMARMDAIVRLTNASSTLVMRPPYALHAAAPGLFPLAVRHGLSTPQLPRNRDINDNDSRSVDSDSHGHAFGTRPSLLRRAFMCPVGTKNCAEIGQANYCCGANERCTMVPDTGAGPVGCCPHDGACGGPIALCPAPAVACPASLGGGCCLQGFKCEGVGCVATSIVTVSDQPMTSTRASVPVPVPAPTTTSVSASPSSTSQLSSTSTTAAPPATTAAPAAPTRPTSGSCPTGFYACLATYGGGCCQTGRDCKVTSCPPLSYSTTIGPDGATLAIPVASGGAGGADSDDAGKQCANGWYLCGSEAGNRPGCCPNNFACGTASCTLTGQQPKATTVQKIRPGQSRGTRMDSRVSVAVAIAAGVMLMVTG